MIYGIASDPVLCSSGRPAEEVPARKLAQYLCSRAVGPDGKALPRMCQRCESQCAYGRRAIKEMTKEAANEKRAKQGKR